MSKKAKVVAGHLLSKHQHASAVSLIAMTTVPFGICKRHIKTEAQFWAAMTYITGLTRKEGETFIEAIYRLRGTVGAKSRERRAEMVNAADRATLINLMGIVTDSKGPEQNIGRQPRQPRAPKPKRTVLKVLRQGTKRPTPDAKTAFYASWDWRTLRLEVIKEHGRECQCCGNRPGMFYASGDPVRIVVDHIKPLSKYWHLRLERSNLQVLCDECNQGKGNWDETDFRSPEAPDEWVEEPQEDIVLSVLAQMNGETVQ